MAAQHRGCRAHDTNELGGIQVVPPVSVDTRPVGITVSAKSENQEPVPVLDEWCKQIPGVGVAPPWRQTMALASGGLCST